MSGNLTQIQHAMVNNEFVDNLQLLSMSHTSDAYPVFIARLTKHLECMIPNETEEKRLFELQLIDHLHQIIPLLEMKLLIDENNYDRLCTETFLQMLNKFFEATCVFEMVNSIKDQIRLRDLFDKYLPLIKQSYFQDDRRCDALASSILPIVSIISIFIPLTENDIPPNLLPLLLAFTKDNWNCPQRMITIRNILAFVKVFGKKPRLVPLLIHCKWPQACLRWLADTNDVELKRQHQIYFYIHFILQKLARHAYGVQLLNELHCITVLQKSQEILRNAHTEEEYFGLQLLQCMVRTLLMEADEIKKASVASDQQMLQLLDRISLTIVEASRTDNYSYNCFHISEPLMVLSKLFVNDNILIEILTRNDNLLECLCSTLVHFASIFDPQTPSFMMLTEETLLAVSNILWSISFHERYRHRLRANSTLMHTVSNLATSFTITPVESKSIPRDLCSVKKATEGILWNLKSPLVIASKSLHKTPQLPLAMISYSHSDSVFCQELVDRLSPHVPVWVDYKQASDAIAHSDDLWEEIARAMETATVIVLIVSKEYYDSKSCRQELSYASDTLKKRIVPVYAPNQQYRASGWLGIRIAGQKYIHFGRKVFATAITELASLVNTEQKPVAVSSRSSLVYTEVSKETKEIKMEKEDSLVLIDWTSKDIRQWFESNRIHPNLISLYADQFHTGTALMIYARHLKYFYCNEYTRIFAKYRQAHNGEQLDTVDFVNLVDALFRLRAEHYPNGNLEDDIDKLGEAHLPSTIRSKDDILTWL